MKIEQYGFRDLHHKYVLITDVKDYFRFYNLEFQCLEGDTALLTYGYIDHTAGLTFEVLCFARKDANGGIQLRPGNDTVSFKIRYDEMKGDLEVIPFDIKLLEFQTKVDIINDEYKGSRELEFIREHTPIDPDRHAECPDDVAAYLFKEGVQTERIWVRTETIIDGKVAGRLLNSPHSKEFGMKEGDLVKLVSVPAQGRQVTVIETAYVYEEKQLDLSMTMRELVEQGKIEQVVCSGLHCNGVYTLYDLVNCSKTEVEHFTRFGRRSYDMLLAFMEEYGLQFAEPVFPTEEVNIRIDELELEYELKECLLNAGVGTVNDILTISAEEFMHIPNLTRKWANQLLEHLREIGVHKHFLLELYWGLEYDLFKYECNRE